MFGYGAVLCSSRVLSLALPVSAVMLGGDWRERHQVSTANPGSILLYDDQLQAMLMLCSLLHFKPDTSLSQDIAVWRCDQSKRISLSTLVASLVKVADKYDCV